VVFLDNHDNVVIPGWWRLRAERAAQRDKRRDSQADQPDPDSAPHASEYTTRDASVPLAPFPLEIPEIMDMLYIEKGIHMRIDAAMPQTQRINEMAAQPQKEVAGEREPDGDADDSMKVAAKTSSANQISPQGVGTKVDLFA
jgi:hypothetical protein